MKINNALGFAGFLHGWDAETEQQRRRQEEDRVRQNNQDMFGIHQALGNLRVGEQQRLDELGQFTQPTKLAQLTESSDAFFKDAPLRQANAEFGRTVETARLDAKNQIFDKDVLSQLFVDKATSNYNNINSAISVNNSNSDANWFNTLARNMNQFNAADVLKKLQLDDRFTAVKDAAGSVMIQPVSDPGRLIPLSAFQNAVLDSRGAYNAIQGDIATLRKGNAATSVANAKTGQANNKATLQGLQQVLSNDLKLLNSLDKETDQYKNVLAEYNNVRKLIIGGEYVQ